MWKWGKEKKWQNDYDGKIEGGWAIYVNSDAVM